DVLVGSHPRGESLPPLRLDALARDQQVHFLMAAQSPPIARVSSLGGQARLLGLPDQFALVRVAFSLARMGHWLGSPGVHFSPLYIERGEIHTFLVVVVVVVEY